MPNSVTIPFGEGKNITLETGRIARQAHGAVTATVGGTMVFAAVVRSNKPAENFDFFPLTVDYREKHYAVGRIPGNFFRRESRPSTMETITARLVDRAIRPMFPDGFQYEVQVHLTVLSMDQKHTTAVPALIAAAAALAISDIPFNGPVAAARIGRANDKFIVNPTFQQCADSVLDLVVAGTKPAICMVESGSECLSEETILEALQLAQESLIPIIDGINDLVKQCGKPKIEFKPSEIPAEIIAAVDEATKAGFEIIGQTYEKHAREVAGNVLEAEVQAKLAAQFTDEKAPKQIYLAFENAYKKYVREQVLSKSLRADGRKLDEIRPISVETQFLPMAHGSAIFTRGQTQSLGVATLGTVGDQQKIDDLMGVSNERFLLHYNFPSYSVGEVRRISGPGRRELGHGMLAQRALAPILPPADKFPYTIRIVSEIMESNGSSSMASVCSGCLSLMDAGVPILAPVAGIAMGMIKDGDRLAVLSDIMGMEDHLGDMDFKVAGTQDGITALQMDIKIEEGLSFDTLRSALAQARLGRFHILGKMAEGLAAPREELSALAPRIEIMKIPVEKIGDLIGPSGKHIRGIIETTGAIIDVQDDGSVFISTSDGEAMKAARGMVLALTANAEIGKVYTGKVVRITDFGCFVEILPKKDGMCHVSELDFSRVEKVTDICREGDMMKVKVIDIDPTGKVRLSRRAALEEEPGFVAPEGYKPRPAGERPERPSHDRHDRGPRSGGHDRGDRGPRSGGHDRDRGQHDRGTRPSSSHSAPTSHDAPKESSVDRGGKSDGDFEADLR